MQFQAPECHASYRWLVESDLFSLGVLFWRFAWFVANGQLKEVTALPASNPSRGPFEFTDADLLRQAGGEKQALVLEILISLIVDCTKVEWSERISIDELISKLEEATNL